jgi:hypothetical protein
VRWGDSAVEADDERRDRSSACATVRLEGSRDRKDDTTWADDTKAGGTRTTENKVKEMHAQ